MGNNINNFRIPQISKVPNKSGAEDSNKLSKGKLSDFEKLLKGSQVENPQQDVKISNHAAKRISERNLNVDSNEFVKIREGIDKLKAKGGKESLVITDNAAYIVDVDNDTVVTAIHKGDMADNVFTKIDSTVFI